MSPPEPPTERIGPEPLEAGLARLRERLRYRFDVFISYSTQQAREAEELHARFGELGLTVFYAPVTLEPREDATDQYVEILREALVQSCQAVVLLSDAYLASSWCTLEMRGYYGLLKDERRRRLWIVTLEEVEKELIGQLVPFLFRGTLDDVAVAVRNAADRRELRLGDEFSQRELPRLFVELPLRERYEQPRPGNRPPWGKDARSPHGVPGAPPFPVYEELVREYMVQLLRGHEMRPLAIPMLGVPESYAYFSKEAERDARALVAWGVSPFRTPFTYPLGERLRDLQASREQGQDAVEIDRLEGEARARAGHFDEGIELMRRGLAAPSKPLRDRDRWLVEIAMAEYLARGYQAALATLEDMLDADAHLFGRLVRSATLARLGRLPDADFERNRASEVRVDDLRINSPLERREDLDWWAEGLELAGYPRL